MNKCGNYRDYYSTDRYRGFYRLHKAGNGFSRFIHLAFSDGENIIVTTGVYIEEAMAKAFQAIDKFHLQQKRKKEQQMAQLSSEQVLPGVRKKRTTKPAGSYFRDSAIPSLAGYQ
ncbi:hypothetical protein [Halalkalibaculum sp. DA384]|uniref:hypothetical protein n=1 Tax=Halalkalibaculum sp. DA384 TaxID=3373606 RepID=UPI003754BD67